MTVDHRRSHLLSLLSEACEIEHALTCSYLFAGFSLRHADLPWEQQQRARLWAAQVYFVASQEMLHLAQVWNLLTAVGGVPYYGRPPFPVDRDYFPLGAPLTLERYAEETLARFVRWEQPAQVRADRGAYASLQRADTGGAYRSVGELYQHIEEVFRAPGAGQLMLGRPEHQVGPELADFPELVKVLTPDDAVRAVENIRDQGEGSGQERESCHFGVFVDLHAALSEPGFDPAHPVVVNPSTRSGSGTLVTDPASAAAMELFDGIYVLMLRMLAWSFGPVDSAGGQAARFTRAALFAMVGVLKPLGETLARLPSGADGNAGASFRIGRHIPLPLDATVARVLAGERCDELRDDAHALVRTHPKVAREIPTLAAQLDAVRDMM